MLTVADRRHATVAAAIACAETVSLREDRCGSYQHPTNPLDEAGILERAARVRLE